MQGNIQLRQRLLLPGGLIQYSGDWEVLLWEVIQGLRPMMIVCPVVKALKRFKSLGSQYNNLFSNPMPWLRAIATIIEIFIVMSG